MLQQLGSKIYVFGGLTDNAISSSVHVLDTDNLQWKELSVSGEWPCAHHSHSMVAYGSQIYMFGGYNGEKILGDLYSFDVHKCLWKKEEVAGKSPHARFSHSMFLYKNYLGVIGANVVGNDLVMIGGGAACYAFGTKFSEPIKLKLLPVAVMSRDDCHVPSEHSKIGEKLVTDQYEGVTGEINVKFEGLQIGNSQTSTQDSHSEAEPNGVNDGHQMVASHWVLQLDRKYAKLWKDILKKFGLLDLGRKAYPQGDGTHICFPVTENFCVVFHEKQHQFGDKSEALNNFIGEGKPFTGESILLNEIPSSTALHLLKECGATKQAYDVVEVRRASKSPLNTMTEAVASLLQRKGLSATLLEQLPSRFVLHNFASLVSICLLSCVNVLISPKSSDSKETLCCYLLEIL
ncbi:hypothetical protein Q3G72_021371 [Acer saccharum]|nr:hypothetical protein Q3G72_021371 [Acer saccharum]